MNYLLYLLKAKGRHGTHSPFIYNMVEQALHENASSPISYTHVRGLSSKEKTLFRVIAYLKQFAPKINIGEEVNRMLPQLSKAFHVNIKTATQGLENQSIYILSPESVEWFLTLRAQNHFSNVYILIWHPGNSAYPLMESLYKADAFNCTIFAWDFSMLISSNDFKRKQHFVLR